MSHDDLRRDIKKAIRTRLDNPKEKMTKDKADCLNSMDAIKRWHRPDKGRKIKHKWVEGYGWVIKDGEPTEAFHKWKTGEKP